MTLDKEYYTLAEVAELLSVTKRTVQRWISDGQLTAIRLNPRNIRIQRSDLNKFLSNKTDK